MAEPKDRLLTAAEAAEWARVSQATMSAWLAAGVLTSIPDGRRKMIRLSHLQQLIRDRAQFPGRRLPADTVTKSSRT